MATKGTCARHDMPWIKVTNRNIKSLKKFLGDRFQEYCEKVPSGGIDKLGFPISGGGHDAYVRFDKDGEYSYFANVGQVIVRLLDDDYAVLDETVFLQSFEHIQP